MVHSELRATTVTQGGSFPSIRPWTNGESREISWVLDECGKSNIKRTRYTLATCLSRVSVQGIRSYSRLYKLTALRFSTQPHTAPSEAITGSSAARLSSSQLRRG